MDIRPYQAADLNGCLALFDSNVPDYFGAQELSEFEAFLQKPDCPYFVLEQDGALFGCGGYMILSGPPIARLVWGMVHRKAHKLGLGRLLLLYRLREIGKHEAVEQVRIETSQFAAPFFEKQGFRIVSRATDGFAPGIDRVAMAKKLAVCVVPRS